MTETHDELTPDERAALESLRDTPGPPAELEETVVGRLRAEGLLRDEGAAGTGAPVRALAAAALVVVLIGAAFFAGRASAPAGELLMAQPTERTYAFLVYQAPESWLLPDSRQAYDETSIWIGELARDGTFQGGAQLQDSAELVALVDGDVRPSGGPPSDATRVMSGFLLIEAPDLAAARRIAAGSPLLRHGYSIEVREIIPD